MKKSLKTFKKVANHNGATILIYGERWEDEFIDGIKLFRAKYSRDGRSIVDLDIFGNDTDILLTRPYTRTRYFNMGWAICSEDDSYNLETGIEICKKRFRKSPLKSESGLFLTNDMVEALLLNEVNYIIGHWDKFYKKPEANSAKPDEETPLWADDAEPVEVLFDEAPEEINPDPPVANEAPEETNSDAQVANEATEETNPDPPVANEAPKKEENVERRSDILAGDYAIILNDRNKTVVGIGVVSEVLDDEVYFEWVYQYEDESGKRKISNSYGTRTLCAVRKNVRLATNEEISNVAKKMSEDFWVKWDPENKVLTDIDN